MCKVCTEAVHSVALWTRVTLGLGMCGVCTEAVHSVALWTRVTLGLGMCGVCTEAVHSVALWTRVTLGLGMCKVCTEAVHSVALWTRVTLQVWTMCALCTEPLKTQKSARKHTARYQHASENNTCAMYMFLTNILTSTNAQQHSREQVYPPLVIYGNLCCFPTTQV